jgi:cyanate permease
VVLSATRWRGSGRSVIGPGLLGLLRDWTGSYTTSLALCIALEILAAALILIRPKRQQSLTDFR